jgi:ABC-type lipoprotein export system ATPase subunit
MKLLERTIAEIYREIPEVSMFLGDYGLDPLERGIPLGHWLESLPEEMYEDIGIDREGLVENLEEYLRQLEMMQLDKLPPVHDITLIGGPTGSGKSRLLADIEWMAQNDTPTGRKILVNGEVPDTDLRFSLEYKLVAQLSQNMNFVMDTTVAEFVAMHAESRMVENIGEVVREIVSQANLLAGEPFEGSTPVTSLSGGQSRALMIADTAFLSSSPVVLIDEIENAGIDRKKALSLLIRKEKIVLMATHDPILALMAERRLVIKNGGILRVITTTRKEKENLEKLEALDNRLLALRTRLRSGELIEEAG